MTEVSSFEQFFREQYTSLVALGVWLTGNRAAGEDLAQDALSATHDRWGDVSRYDRPGAFARRAMINLASNERRRRGREWRALRRLAAVRDAAGATRPSSTSVELEPLWVEVAALPLQQRAAIALRYLADLPAAEIADELDCSEATVRVHLHRAHRRLAERLDASYDPGPATEREESSP